MNSFKGPVTSEIQDLFRKWGVDPDTHERLVIDLMNFTYDNMTDAVKDTRKHVTNTVEDAII
jgi:hypothetical protein